MAVKREAVIEKEVEKETESRQVKTIEQDLPVMLTSEEKLEMGQQLAQAEQARSEAESRLTTFRAQMKATIEGATAKIDGLVSRISSGYEYRAVRCERTDDFKTGWITIVRTDTGEVVQQRAMSAAEQQRGLDI